VVELSGDLEEDVFSASVCVMEGCCTSPKAVEPQTYGTRRPQASPVMFVGIPCSERLAVNQNKLYVNSHWHEALTATCLSSAINTMQSTRRSAGTPTPQALQVPGAESPRAQPSQGCEPTQTIEITGVLDHLHIFGANNTLGSENRYCSRGPA
jgi:hypothetical protein